MDDDKDLDLTDDERRERFEALLASMPPPLPDDAPFATLDKVAEIFGCRQTAIEAFDHGDIPHTATITAGQFRKWFKETATCDDD